MPEVCAVCGDEVDDEAALGIGTLVFHAACLPTCRFCEQTYTVEDHGWDIRGGVTWSDDWGYVPRLETAACGSCSDTGERRDYGLGW